MTVLLTTDLPGRAFITDFDVSSPDVAQPEISKMEPDVLVTIGIHVMP